MAGVNILVSGGRRDQPIDAWTTLTAMGRKLAKKPIALVGSLGTMAAIWWFALRPRFRKRP